jgi:hypothetical protein
VSLFERVWGWLRGASGPPAAAPPAAAAQPPTVAEEPSVGARAPEEISARTLATAKDDRVALAAYEALVASLGEASAIAAARARERESSGASRASRSGARCPWRR